MDKEYDDLFQALVEVSVKEERELIKACEDNCWLNSNKRDGYSFKRLDSIKLLKKYFTYGKWPLKTGIVFKNLVFVKQSADDWWVLRRGKKIPIGGTQYNPCNSCPMYQIAINNIQYFESHIEHLMSMEPLGYASLVQDEDLNEKNIKEKEVSMDKTFGYYKCNCGVEYISNYPFSESRCLMCFEKIPLLKRLNQEEVTAIQKRWGTNGK